MKTSEFRLVGFTPWQTEFVLKAVGSRLMDRVRPGLYQEVSRVGGAMEADPFNPEELRAATRKLRAVVENSGWSDLDIRSLATGICVTAKRMRLAAGAAHRPTRDRGRRGGDGR